MSSAVILCKSLIDLRKRLLFACQNFSAVRALHKRELGDPLSRNAWCRRVGGTVMEWCSGPRAGKQHLEKMRGSPEAAVEEGDLAVNDEGVS
jgi:hypothetical protein